MPTGYTADVADGKVTDFRTFALRCARQFGATIMQRDDPMDKPPKHRVPSDYYDKALEEERGKLAALNAMTLDDAAAAQKAEADTADALDAQYAAKREETRTRYEAMIAEVRAWTPPTADHVEMKSFMLAQLADSIKWDCTIYAHDREPMTPAAWLDGIKEHTRKNIARYAKEAEKERLRCEESNRWIDALYKSLEAA